MFCREIRGDCLSSFPWGNQGDRLGGRFGENLRGNLGCKLWKEKIYYLKKLIDFFWDSNRGQIDDFH